MTTFTFRPIVWAGPRTPDQARRSRYTFKAAWIDTLDLLEREIDHLGGTEATLEADFREGDLRIDGMVRANARTPDFPGIRLSFNTARLGRLAYATDAYAFWQHNVRAIALGLEALRAVDRYGITRDRQQYTGFKAIGAGPTPMPAAAPTMSRQEAAEFIARTADPVGGGRMAVVARILAGDVDPSYRAAARKLHPDTGGNARDFQRLQDARAALNA